MMFAMVDNIFECVSLLSTVVCFVDVRRIWFACKRSTTKKNPITSMYSLQLPVRALRLVCRHQSCPVSMSLAVAVTKTKTLTTTMLVALAVVVIVAFASLIAVASKSFGFAWAAVVAGCPGPQASFVRSLLQLVLVHGPKRDYYNLWAHSIDSCRDLVQIIMMSVFLDATTTTTKRTRKM